MEQNTGCYILVSSIYHSDLHGGVSVDQDCKNLLK